MWGWVVTLLGSELLKKFTFETGKYLAQRAMLIALCLFVVPIALFKGFGLITRFMLNYSGVLIEGEELEPVIVQLVGVGAYIGSLMMIPEGISIFLGFLLLSFTLRMIRVK